MVAAGAPAGTLGAQHHHYAVNSHNECWKSAFSLVNRFDVEGSLPGQHYGVELCEMIMRGEEIGGVIWNIVSLKFDNAHRIIEYWYSRSRSKKLRHAAEAPAAKNVGDVVLGGSISTSVLVWVVAVTVVAVVAVVAVAVAVAVATTIIFI
jgi:hypothetical protein